jgi:hypothetical protein
MQFGDTADAKSALRRNLPCAACPLTVAFSVAKLAAAGKISCG